MLQAYHSAVACHEITPFSSLEIQREPVGQKYCKIVDISIPFRKEEEKTS